MKKIIKTIHYCWFGHNPLPESAKKCIESWRKYCPDYKIICWNEDNYDVNKIPYIKEAYEVKKYAFVSDYARFDILNKYGGLYLDTDVEIIRPLNQIIMKGPFMALESGTIEGLVKMTHKKKLCLAYIATGLGVYAEPNMDFLNKILKKYESMHFVNKDKSLNTTTVCKIITDLAIKNEITIKKDLAYFGGFLIYPPEYFNPKGAPYGIIKLTPKTYTIHHYDASWLSDKEKKWFEYVQKKKIKKTPEKFKKFEQSVYFKVKLNIHFFGYKKTIKKIIHRLFKF